MPSVRIVTPDAHGGLLSFAEGLEAVYEGYRDRADYRAVLVDEPRHRLIDPETGARVSNHFGLSPTVGVGGAFLHAQQASSDADRQEFAGAGAPVRVVYDTETAELRAIVLGDISGAEFPSPGLSAFPTALETAVGTDVLAREDASVLGILGSGRQARNSLVAHDHVRDLEAVRVYSPTRQHREDFAAEMSGVIDLDIEPVEGPGDVIAGAEIVLCATNASTPVFDGDLLEPGQHVTSIVGSDLELVQADQAPRLRREIDDRTAERADLYVANSVQQAKNNRQGDFVYPVLAGVLAWEEVIDLPEVVGGSHPGRERDDQITVYKQNSIQGVTLMALAGRLLDRVEERDLGTEVSLR